MKKLLPTLAAISAVAAFSEAQADAMPIKGECVNAGGEIVTFEGSRTPDNPATGDLDQTTIQLSNTDFNQLIAPALWVNVHAPYIGPDGFYKAGIGAHSVRVKREHSTSYLQASNDAFEEILNTELKAKGWGCKVEPDIPKP